MSEPVCPSCGHAEGLGEDGRCTDKAKCARRALRGTVQRPFVGGFDPDAAYADAEKGAA